MKTSIVSVERRLEEEGYKPLDEDNEDAAEMTISSPFLRMSLKDLNVNISDKVEVMFVIKPYIKSAYVI